MLRSTIYRLLACPFFQESAQPGGLYGLARHDSAVADLLLVPRAACPGAARLQQPGPGMV
jgi:hypothetical protein